jgi:hypothetical protein
MLISPLLLLLLLYQRSLKFACALRETYDHPRIYGGIFYLDLRAIYHEKGSKIERAMIKAKIQKAKKAFLIIQPNLSTKMETQITETTHAIISPRCSYR